MSVEERLAKQLESIAGSIIKALESLEKELSEYIEVTNKRLHILEDKVKNFESLAVVTNKNSYRDSQITSSSSIPTTKIETPITHQQTVIASTPEIKQPTLTPPTVSSPPPEASIQKMDRPIEPIISAPEGSKLPPVPKPPAFEPTISEEKPQLESQELDPPVTDDEKSEKKDGDDKEELMSALKIIDSL